MAIEWWQSDRTHPLPARNPASAFSRADAESGAARRASILDLVETQGIEASQQKERQPTVDQVLAARKVADIARTEEDRKSVREQIKMFCYYRKDDVFIPTMGLNTMDLAIYVNHSKSPNVRMKRSGYFETLREIHKGEELFMDYDDSFGEKHIFD
mgnify:CR=1 FL=1